MSVKLSELLEAAGASLQNQRARCYQCGNNEGQKHAEDDMYALRAIAPALVEVVAANNEFECVIMSGKAPDAVDAWTRVTDRTNAAWRALLTAMKEAGVTCE